MSNALLRALVGDPRGLGSAARSEEHFQMPSCEELARTLSGRRDAHIEWGDHPVSAEITTGRIRLPDPRTVDATERPAAMRIVHLWLAHEAAHLAFSVTAALLPAAATGVSPPDAAPLVRATAEARRRWGDVFHVLWRCAEDLRVDRLQCERFPCLVELFREVACDEAWVAGDPRRTISELGLGTQLAQALLLVGRRVLVVDDLPTSLRALLAAVRGEFETVLSARVEGDCTRSVDALLAVVRDLAERAAETRDLDHGGALWWALDLHTTPDPTALPRPSPGPGEREDARALRRLWETKRGR